VTGWTVVADSSVRKSRNGLILVARA
jgi:hypothetical protein